MIIKNAKNKCIENTFNAYTCFIDVISNSIFIYLEIGENETFHSISSFLKMYNKIIEKIIFKQEFTLFILLLLFKNFRRTI